LLKKLALFLGICLLSLVAALQPIQVASAAGPCPDPMHTAKTEVHDISLAGHNFDGQCVTNTHFTNVDLTGVSFVGAIIINSQFTHCSMVHSDFRDANLKLWLDSVDLTGANFSGSIGEVFAKNTDFIKTDLSRANWTRGRLYGDFGGANLDAAKLQNIVFGPLSFNNATMSGTDFSGSVCYGCSGSKIEGIPIVMPAYRAVPDSVVTIDSPREGPPLVLGNGYLIGPDTNLQGADLNGLDLSGVDLPYNLAHANLTGASLTGDDLTHTNFDGTVLVGADLKYVKVVGGSKGTLRTANLEGAKTDRTTCLLSQVVYTPILQPGVDLSYVDIENVPSDLLCGWGDLTGVSFKGAQLKNVDFKNWNLSRADLTNSTLTNLNLSGVSLLDAKLKMLKSMGLMGNPSLPTGFVLSRGTILGPEVDLRNQDLQGADLSNINLTGAACEGMRTDSANFWKTWACVSGYLIRKLPNGPAPVISGRYQVGQTLSAVEAPWPAAKNLRPQCW